MLGRCYRGKQNHRARIATAQVTLHRNRPSPWNNTGQTIPSPSVRWMERRWAVRSTGCRQANYDAGGTALLGLCRGWGHPDTQDARVCVLLALRSAMGRSLQSPSPGTSSVWSPLQMQGELVSHLCITLKLFSLGCICRSLPSLAQSS